MSYFFVWALAWCLMGTVSWFVFVVSEGRLTVGDVVVAFLVAPTGPMLPMIIGMFHFVRVLDCFFHIVLWEKKP